MTTEWRDVGKLKLVCQGAMCGTLLVWNEEQAYYQCPTRGPNCRFIEHPWGELVRKGEECGVLPRVATVDIFLVPEGAKPNPPVFWFVPVSEAVILLGLSGRLPYSAGLPQFNADQSSSLDGVREPRVAVAKIDAPVAKMLKLQEGYYVLKKTAHEIKTLRAQRQ